MWTETALKVSEIAHAEGSAAREAAPSLRHENDIVECGRPAHAGGDVLSKAREVQSGGCSSADYSDQIAAVLRGPVNCSAPSHEPDTEKQTVNCVSVLANPVRTSRRLIMGRSGVSDQRADETAVHDGAVKSNEQRGSVAAASQAAALQGSNAFVTGGAVSGDGGLIWCENAGGHKSKCTSELRNGFRRESCGFQEVTNFIGKPKTFKSYTGPATVPACLREPPQIDFETRGRQKRNKSKSSAMHSHLEPAESGDAAIAVELETGTGCGKHDAEEAFLRRILCELNRQELECMQERMQRSVAYLLETRKEKQAEHLALLQQRRRLDAALACAQSLLKQNSAVVRRDSGQCGRFSCSAKKMSAAFVKSSLISTSVTCTRAPVSPLHLCGCGSVMREKAVSAENTKGSAPTSSLSPGVYICHDLARHSEIKEISSSCSGTKVSKGDRDESILADLLDDLLHRYAPAAVKGVGAAAHKVKEGLGALRLELLALQQHQQATEQQRAIERHARFMLRLEEEMEHVQHHRVLQHLKNLHVSAASDSGRPSLCFSAEHMPSSETDPREAETPSSPVILRANVDVSVSEQAVLRLNESGHNSALNEIRGGFRPACKVVREHTYETSGKKRLCYVASSQPPHACICTMGKSRLEGRASAETYQIHQHAVQTQQQMYDSLEHLNKHAAGPAAPHSPLESARASATAAVRQMSNVANPADADLLDRHSVQADQVTGGKDLNAPKEYSSWSSINSASLYSCGEVNAVEGKGTSWPFHFSEYCLDIEKHDAEAEAFTRGKTRGVREGWDFAGRRGRGESHQPNLRSSGCPASATVHSEPLVYAAKPSAYKKLGTRKERLQKTAASLDSLSRGVVDAVGSVKHTVARWLSAFENSSEASEGNGAATWEDTASDCTTARTCTRADSVRGQNPPSAELSVKRTELDYDQTSVLLETRPFEMGSAAVRQHVGQEAEQLAQVGSNIVSRDKEELPEVEEILPENSINATSASERTTNSNMSSVMAPVADGGVVGKASVTAENLLRAASAEPSMCGYRNDRILYAENEEGGRQEKCRGPSTPASPQLFSTGEETKKLLRATSEPSAYETHAGETLRAAVTGAFLMSRGAGTPDTTANRSRSSQLEKTQLGVAAPTPRLNENGPSCSINSVGAEVQTSRNERGGSADEQDLVVIEALIHVGGKNGVVALPLVVLATEQCRDIAEEWVDRHWVQLQQTQFRLMRGRSGANETAPKNDHTRGLASRGDISEVKAIGKLITSSHFGELPREEGLAGRSASGGGAAKTTFLTRSRAIHSLAAFLGHAEATSEQLPVRVVEDWANIISSPTKDATHVPRQQPRQKVGHT